MQFETWNKKPTSRMCITVSGFFVNTTKKCADYGDPTQNFQGLGTSHKALQPLFEVLSFFLRQ